MSEPVLITGATSDIGVELVRRLAGADTVILAHGHTTIERIDALARSLPPSARVIPLSADLRDPNQIEALIQTVLGTHGPPRGLVHLPARPLRLTRFSDQKWEDLIADLELQVRSAMLLLQGFLPRMAAPDRRGKVVLMLSSVTIGVPPSAMSSYVVAKYALLGLMRALAVEYADKGLNINAISPSTVETRFLDAVPRKFAEISAAKSPLKRNARPEDIIPLIKFLLSTDSDYLTGLNIPIAGGAVG